MLITFSVEPDALSEITDAGTFDNLYRNFWIPYGILVDAEGDASLRLIDSNFADELQNAFKSYKSNGWPYWTIVDEIAWDDILAPDDLAKFQDKFKLALLGEFRATLALKVPDNNGVYSMYCGDIEAIRFQHVTLSKEFARAVRLADDNILVGQSVSQLWEDRFQALAKHSEQITIVDRYALENLASGAVELSKLLEFLQRDSLTGCRVTIYSSSRNMSVPDIQCIKEILEEQISNIIKCDKIEQCTVFISYDDVFVKRAHDRYIRFGGYTCTIGRGIEVFRESNVRYESDFSLKSPEHLMERRDIEKALRKRRFKSDSIALPWRWR